MTQKRAKQIVTIVGEELHQQIKILAAVKKISMNLWIIRAIQERISKEAKYDHKAPQNNNE